MTDFGQSRDCFATPPAAADKAADLLSQAADHILTFEVEVARQLVVEADIGELGEFARKLMGSTIPEIHQFRIVPGAPTENKGHGQRMPSKSFEYGIYARDGWRCRFCGVRGLDPRGRKVITDLFPNETRWSGSDKERHHALLALSLSLDHILPYSRGGNNSDENLLAACYPCQFGRNKWTLEEVGLNDPRQRAPVVDQWDGLTRLL